PVCEVVEQIEPSKLSGRFAGRVLESASEKVVAHLTHQSKRQRLRNDDGIDRTFFCASGANQPAHEYRCEQADGGSRPGALYFTRASVQGTRKLGARTLRIRRHPLGQIVERLGRKAEEVQFTAGLATRAQLYYCCRAQDRPEVEGVPCGDPGAGDQPPPIALGRATPRKRPVPAINLIKPLVLADVYDR